MNDCGSGDSGGEGYAGGTARLQQRSVSAAASVGRRYYAPRADASSLRALILGALGVLGACGGKSSDAGPALGGVTDTGGGTDAESASAPTGCPGPTMDLGGGFERCSNGAVHRTEVGDCSSFGASELGGGALSEPTGDEAANMSQGGTGQGGAGQGGAGQGGAGQGGAPPGCVDCCTKNSDCTALPHGRCAPDIYGDPTGFVCIYGCVNDSECGQDQICRCDGAFGTCENARCRVDADCPNDLLCTEYDRSPGCPQYGFACQTPDDQCGSSAQCESTEAWCGFEQGASARACMQARCAVGRPFLVGDHARLAPCEVRDDWYVASDGALPGARPLPPLDAPLREAVRAGWLQQALMEHASVAAFARFSLQLAGLGAPPDLLASAARAMLDEIAHARGCFELARRHSDVDVGPGPLPVADALEDCDLESVVRGAIAEGCIGETIAALEAAELALHTEDTAAQALLERIASDEAQHAQLAWRFVAWALASGPASLHASVEAAFHDAVRSALAIPEPHARARASKLDAALLAQGLASETLRQELRRRAVIDIVAPCAATLLDRDTFGADSSGRSLRLTAAVSANRPRQP